MLHLAETDSTNNCLKDRIAVDERWISGEKMPAVWADYQTAGRGQAGNGWESRRGENLLCSLMLKAPEVTAGQQFRLSMLVGMALRETVREVAPESGDALTVKWPNDLYCGDGKLAGVLIENTLSGGRIACSVVGIGLNINQTEWSGGVPNPTSLRLLTRRKYDVQEVLTTLVRTMETCAARPQQEWRDYYMRHLYRRTGMHAYVEREVSLAPTTTAESTVQGIFRAEIEGLTDAGELILRKENGERKNYHFKEIRFVREN